MSWWPPARNVLGVDWNSAWRKCARGCRTGRRAGQPRPVPAEHHAGSGGGRRPVASSGKCGGGRGIFSTSATVCRPRRNWKTSRAWWRLCEVSNEHAESRSRAGEEIQRAGPALHLLSAGDAFHRGRSRPTSSPSTSRANNQTDARPLALLPPPVLRDALLVLRLHHRHHRSTTTKSADYVDYLEREMAQMKPLLNPRRKVVQLHFGGGSPTFLRPDEIRRLGEHDPLAVHVRAGHRSRRRSGPAPAHARPPRRAARSRLQPRLDGRAGLQSRRCSRPSTASSRSR